MRKRVFMKPNDKIDPNLMSKLAALNNLPERDPERSSATRSKFMQQARDLASKPARVTPVGEPRHNGWIQGFQTMFMPRRKEHSPMFSTLATILVIVSLVLGGSGITVASAQSAQPDEPLYGVKLWSEDARLGLTSDPLIGYQLALEFTNRRVAEIQTMLEAGGIPPESVEIRYQNQVEQAIRLALNLPDNQANLALEQIRTRLQTQLELMLQIRSNGAENAEALLYQTRQMIQERLQWVEKGIADPNQAREQFRELDQERSQEQNQEGSQNQEQNQYQNGQSTGDPSAMETQLAPGSTDGNPWTTGTPTPNSSYGPGPGTGEENPWTTGIPTPGSSYGPGPDDGNPWTTGTPTPGSGYGPGPGTGTCTATCDGTGSCQGSAIGTGEPKTEPGGNN